MTLFEYAAKYPLAPGFKAAGASEEAARRIKPLAPSLREQVLAALKLYGPSTADEIAAHLGRSILSVRPRCAELHALKLIEPTAERRRNDSGMSAHVWRAL